MSTPKPLPQRSRTSRTLNLIVNGLVAVAWMAGAVMFAGEPNPFGRSGPAKITWVVYVLFAILGLMLIGDLRTAFKTRGQSMEAISGILMWLGFLAGLTYAITDFAGSSWLGAAAASLVGLSFIARVVMTLLKTPPPPQPGQPMA